MPPKSSVRASAATARLVGPRRYSACGAFGILAASFLIPALPAGAAADTVKVGTRIDRGSGRLELEWQRPVDYTVTRSGSYIFIRFSRPLAGRLEPARGALNRYLDDLRVAGGGRVLVMRMAGEPRFAHQRRGNSVVLIWAGAGINRAAAEGPTDSGAPERAAPKAVPEPAPGGPVAVPEPTPGGPVTMPEPAPGRPVAPPARRVETPPLPPAESPPVPSSPRPQEAKPPEMAKGPESHPAPKPEIPPAPEARPAPEGSIEPPVMPAISPTLTVSSNSAETRVVLAWPEPVAAAVFRYGDHVWMIFPRRQAFDVEPFQRMLGPGVEKLVRIDHPQATILAARARADVRARVAHERNVWTVVLKRENSAAPTPDVKIAISRGSADQVAVPLPGAEAPIRLIDPEIGSTLFVVPSRALAGLGAGRSFVTFRLVPTLQGGVIEALADGLTVGAGGGAITLRRSGGLFLSNGSPPSSAQHGQ